MSRILTEQYRFRETIFICSNFVNTVHPCLSKPQLVSETSHIRTAKSRIIILLFKNVFMIYIVIELSVTYFYISEFFSYLKKIFYFYLHKGVWIREDALYVPWLSRSILDVSVRLTAEVRFSAN